jgi:citrate lyase subunit beta / citryl-CoA lyase
MTSRLLRTALYVPAANEKAVRKADSLGADAVIMDLEDSVSPDHKPQARALPGAVSLVKSLHIIRVNASGTPWHEDDIDAGVAASPHAMLLPKAGSPEDIWSFRRLIMLRRPRNPVAVWAMIETPMGVLNVAAIAAALGPDGVIVLGLNDLAKETGMAQQPGRAPMLSVLTSAVIAARAHGVGVLDGVYNSIGDADGFAAECHQGRAFGFDGKTVIHPSQVKPANTIYSPSSAEVDDAQSIVAAFALAENAGKGVIALSGRMVERLHLDMAEALLKTAAAITAKDL